MSLYENVNLKANCPFCLPFTNFPLRLWFSFNTNKYKQFYYLMMKYGEKYLTVLGKYFIQICTFYEKLKLLVNLEKLEFGTKYNLWVLKLKTLWSDQLFEGQLVNWFIHPTVNSFILSF